MAAKYSLNTVKQFAQSALDNPMEEIVFFSAPSKSIDCVMDEFQLKGKPIDPLAAKVYILESILELQDSDFFKTKEQWADAFADWYGIVKDDVPWLIKFLLETDEDTKKDYLEQISFHRANWDMKLSSGRTIKIDGSVS